MEGIAPIPSTAELEQHYRQLAEERKRLEEMLERTDRIMAGVKRGLDEMRAGGSTNEGQPSQAQQSSSSPSQGPQGQAQQTDGSAASVPLARQEKGNREGGGGSVWPVAPPASQPAARE